MNLRQRNAREEPEVNLISLVDVVLLLLIFFMLTSSFVRQSQLAVRLPEASATEQAAVPERPPLEITVTARGEFFVNGRALVDNRPETLAAAIRRVQADVQTAGEAVISADARAAHQDVVTAMDVVGRLGITEVQISTIRPRPE
ncbi:MAG: biopolymer transporter ExbD [Gammaproteobacteria bacterium]|nr:MAG: biopolymer transporter ExbD [Gammaproteobacteria bacterium]